MQKLAARVAARRSKEAQKGRGPQTVGGAERPRQSGKGSARRRWCRRGSRGSRRRCERRTAETTSEPTDGELAAAGRRRPRGIADQPGGQSRASPTSGPSGTAGQAPATAAQAPQPAEEVARCRSSDLIVAGLIVDVPDFPRPGVDLPGHHPAARVRGGLAAAIDAGGGGAAEVDLVLGMEARGFIFGAPVAYGTRSASSRCGNRASCPGRRLGDLRPGVRHRDARRARRRHPAGRPGADRGRRPRHGRHGAAAATWSAARRRGGRASWWWPSWRSSTPGPAGRPRRARRSPRWSDHEAT